MPQLEYKATAPIELSELNTERRTAVIAHAVFDNIDKKKDISRATMFDKTWKEQKAEDIGFYIDHKKSLRPGMVKKLYRDEKKAYTGVKFSQSTLGTDTMLMMDEGIIRGASFGFYTIKANPIKWRGQNARELIEVLQDETTVTYELDPINDLAGVVRVTKAQGDALAEFKAHLDRIELFCRDTTATDETIIKLEAEVKAARGIISEYDANTLLITEPNACNDDNDIFRKKILLLNQQFVA